MAYGSGLYGSGGYGGGGSGPGSLITELWQVEFRNTVWGGLDGEVQITDITGWWDKPSLRGSSTDRPGRHGATAGRKHAETRTVEIELTVAGDDEDMAILRAIDDVCAYSEEPAEEPVVIWAKSTEPLLVAGRLEKVAIPTDHEWSVGHHRIRLQWVCTDPRRYSWQPYTSPVLGMPGGVSTGITEPLVAPISAGGGVASGSLILPNTGNAAAYPVLTLTGELSGPVITRADTGQQLKFAASFVLADGQTLTIDTGTRSVLLDGAVSRRDALIVADWFSLPRGSNTVINLGSTGSYDPSAGLSAAYRFPQL
jgi:hypothetical protein